jgi:uncharacterized membrane protein
MKQQRLDGLADGIFAIVMTLLVFDLKVPVILGVSNPADYLLLNALTGIWTIFLSLVLSFALLFTYWRSHHFIASVYAKNINVGLANINAVFFFFITLVPFVAHFLGQYPHSIVAISLYGVTVIAIGLTLFYMRIYVEQNPEIETTVITKADRRSGYIRILFPVFSAAVAILLSYWNTYVSMLLFTLAILFNILPASSNSVHKWLDMIFADDEDLVEGNYHNPMKDLANNEEFICVPKSAVFDHHRFKEADAAARALLTGSKIAKTKSGKNSDVKGPKIIKTKSVSAPKINKATKKINKQIEKEIEKELEAGTAEDVIVKNEI